MKLLSGEISPSLIANVSFKLDVSFEPSEHRFGLLLTSPQVIIRFNHHASVLSVRHPHLSDSSLRERRGLCAMKRCAQLAACRITHSNRCYDAAGRGAEDGPLLLIRAHALETMSSHPSRPSVTLPSGAATRQTTRSGGKRSSRAGSGARTSGRAVQTGRRPAVGSGGV